MMALSCNQARLLVWMLLLLNLSKVQTQCPRPVLPPHSSLREGRLEDSYPVGTVLRLKCIPGYEPISGKIPRMTCRDSSTWSDLPTLCQGKRCPVPHFENGRIIDSVDFRLGEEITLGCDYGFRLIGGNTRRCILKDGEVVWNRDLPFCERIPCARPPIIPNGRYDPSPTDSYDAGWAVTYRCDADYTLIGNSTITCVVAKNGVDGEWNWPSPECKSNGKRCPIPRFDNGRIVTSVDLHPGDEVTFACDYGFRIVGGNTRRCVLKQGKVDWNRDLPFCDRISCALPPVIPNGRYDASPSDSYETGWAVTYRCDAGYSLIGNSTITCVVAKNGVDEEWNWPSPECKKSLEVRLDIIEKKLDQILHILQLTGYSKTIRNNDN